MFRFGKMHDQLGKMQKSCPFLGRMRPFRIIGNVFFVGTYQASCHIINTGDGLVLIDPGYASSAYLVVDSIYQLGFNPRDVKYIVNTHWHDDHTGATAAFADLSGAKTLIGRDDAEKASTYFQPDILINDGDTLTLGDTVIRFVHTPGHTKGTVSLFFDVSENGKVYHCGMFGGAGLNTLVPSAYDFDGCREAYYESLRKMKAEKVDVFLGNHTWNNDTYNKSLKLLSTGENDFIDSRIWYDFMDVYEKKLTSIIESEG